MIKLKLEFATGIEMREALEQLLNGSLVVTKITLPEPTIGAEKIAENFEASKIEVVKDEKPAEEITTGKKRRGKIESEKTALSVVPSDDPETTPSADAETNDMTETLAQDNKEQTTVTAQMLQEKAVAEIRKGKKEEVVAVIKKFGGDSISQADKNPLKPEVYADVMDAFNKL